MVVYSVMRTNLLPVFTSCLYFLSSLPVFISCLHFLSLTSVPGAPRNLTASANSSTVIVVKFTSPLVTNGILTRFEVTHRGENSTSDESVNVTVQAGAEYCVYLVGLDPFTLYGIRVRAHTSAGPGVSVDTEERTLEGG